MDYMWLVWLIIAIIFLVIELSTVALVSLWFVLGAIVAMIAAMLGANLTVQIILMVIVSIVALLFSYRYMDRFLVGGNYVATNADAVIGQTGIVTRDIDNMENVGEIRVRGQIWSAISAYDDVVIVEGTEVKVLEIKGVKLVVEPEQI